MKQILFLFIAILTSSSLFAQELKMTVSVKTQEIKTVDPRVFNSLERSISDFYNNTQWTEDEYEEEEKIECNLQLTIKEELSTTSFAADLVIQVIRPVYNSNYSTQIFNHIEKSIQFSYQELQPLQNNTQVYTDNLSALLTFYAYIIIGTDYDSFSALGGDPYFQIARSIVTNVPSGNGDNSWDYTGGLARSRGKLLSDILSPSVTDFRQAMYEYHRLGLDIIGEDPIKARAAISAALVKIGGVERALPKSMILKIFSDSKLSELVEIYKPAPGPEKGQVYDILVKLDPAQADEIADLKN